MVNISSIAGKGNVSKFCIKFKLDVGFWRTYFEKIRMIYLPPEIKMVFYRILECIIELLFIKKKQV